VSCTASKIPRVVSRRPVAPGVLRRLLAAAFFPAAALLLAVALLAACKSSPNPASLPQGAQLLQQSGQAMADVNSAHVDLKFEGDLCCFITSAQGDVSRDGKANGSFVLGGAEYPFRLLNGKFYLKGPTGGWVSSAPPYDPTTLLNQTTGLPSILTNATAGQTQASESVGGVDAYRVTASIPTGLVKSLTDLASGQDTLKATAWIAASGSQLLKFRIPFRAKDAKQDTVLTGNLTHFGVAVNVTPPA
jgi:lipoprotein LprG